MFYNGQFVGNHEDLLDGDYTKAKSLGELESLIDSLTKTLRTFGEHNAPDILKNAYQLRLEDVMEYYRKMGGI